MKKMTKILSMILALIMLLALCACGQTATPAATATPAESVAPEESAAPEETAEVLTTVSEGKLTVATSPDFAPYEFYAIGADGQPSLAGFDMALAQYIADYLGLELEVVPMDFDGVLLELANGSVDLGMAGLSPDPTRADAMNFSDLYYQGGQSFVTIEGNEDKFASIEDINKAGYSIGAQNGSIQMDLANEFAADTDIIALAKVTDIIADLVAGNLDGAFIETLVAENYAKSYPQIKIVLDVPYDVAGSAVGVVKGNDLLLAKVNEAIAAALADGSMTKFIEEANDAATGDVYLGLLENK